MKKILENLLKNNKFIYYLYSNIINSVLSFFRLFIKIDNKMILFNSFGGKRYDDSPRCIFEYMKKNSRYSDYKFYWGINDPKKCDIVGATVLKNNSIKYFYIALKSKYWITNSSIERGLKFKNKGTVYINTWHGSAIKKIEKDMQEDSSVRLKVTEPDYYFAQSKYDINIFSKAFGCSPKKILLSGLPRNDELVDNTHCNAIEIRKKLKLPLDKKIILYAPTYREYEKDKFGCVLIPPINLELWKKELANEYCVLFRAHYEVNKVLNIKNDEFCKNVSDYENLNELLILSDILISDYSSIMIDYSILERPIFCYAYDYGTYLQKRGLYIDIRKELPNGAVTSEEELLQLIKECDFVEEKNKTKKFKEKYVQVYGKATEYIDKIIK